MAKKEEVVVSADLAPDPFLERANAYAGLVERNAKLIVGVAALGVVAAIAGVMLGRSGERKASERTAALTAAVDGYNDTVDLQKTLTTTVPATLAQQARDAMPKLEAVAGTPDAVGAIAKLYLADLARRAGDQAKAEAAYREYLKATPASDPLRFTAQEGLGYALEAQGKLDEAATAFTELAESNDKAFADLALIHQGRIKEAKGDKAGATELYRSLLDKFPESKLRDRAEQRISALQ